MGSDSPERPPIGARYQYLWAALTALGTIALAVLTYFLVVADDEPASPPTTSAVVASGAPTTATGSATTAGGVVVTTASAPPGPRLGREVASVGNEPCRAPNVASGGAWQLGEVGLSGRRYDTGYQCNLFSGGSGFLDFDLARTYRELQISLGFADGEGGTSHSVRFEIIGNGQEFLTEPRILKFGQEANLTVNTTGVARLRLKITELSPVGGSGAASRPVVANLRLTPAG